MFLIEIASTITFEHIESSAGILGGKPSIKGTRISIGLILETIANGVSVEDVLRKLSRLKQDNGQEAM